MTYSNQYNNSISTVQLSPFSEEHWNRIVTYSPIYVHWTDLVLMSDKQTPKPKSAKRHFVNTIDINSMKLDDDDELLLNEIQDIRRASIMPRLTVLREKHMHHEGKFLDDDDHAQRPTSPADEYQTVSDSIHDLRESPKSHANTLEPAFLNKQSIQQIQPTATNNSNSSNTGHLKVLGDINLGPKPRASLGVQLRQSAITREHVRASTTEHRYPLTPLPTSSLQRISSGIHSARRTTQPYRTSNSQTPQTNETNMMNHLNERISTDSSSLSMKKSYLRSTNTSRTTMNMIKTKNERERQKQNIELKTILVDPWKQPLLAENVFNGSVPNSIELMRTLGGPTTAFERNLRHNYHRQLNLFRNNSTNTEKKLFI